jgi:hypothetical protein
MMPNEVDRIAGRAVAGAFLGEARGAQARAVEKMYDDFLSTLNAPEAREAFSQHIFDHDQALARAVGIPARSAKKAADAKRREIEEKYFGNTADKVAFFEKYLGPEAVKEALGSFGGEVESPATSVRTFLNGDGNVVALMGIEKRGPPDSNGFDVLRTENLGRAAVTFADDGSINDFRRLRLSRDELRQLYDSLCATTP